MNAGNAGNGRKACHCPPLVGRGSGIAEKGTQRKKCLVGRECATPRSCRAGGSATHGSAVFGCCFQYTNETLFGAASLFQLFRSLALPVMGNASRSRRCRR